MAHQEVANDKKSVVISRKIRENCKMMCTCLSKAMVTFNFFSKKEDDLKRKRLRMYKIVLKSGSLW